MVKSVELLKREIAFMDYRILLIRKGKVTDITLKEAMEYKKDYILALEILEKR